MRVGQEPDQQAQDRVKRLGQSGIGCVDEGVFDGMRTTRKFSTV